MPRSRVLVQSTGEEPSPCRYQTKCNVVLFYLGVELGGRAVLAHMGAYGVLACLEASPMNDLLRVLNLLTFSCSFVECFSLGVILVLHRPGAHRE